MTEEDALNHFISVMRSDAPLGKFGYEVHLDEVIGHYLKAHRLLVADTDRNGRLMDELSPHFLSAAWDLCRRGILRPGVRERRAQATQEGAGGTGYCLTPFGRRWLADATSEKIAALIPGRFVELLGRHTRRFGAGYTSRGSEAIRCYNAHAYLACCAMCGAAAESILLALASERQKPAAVIELYRRAGGRAKVQNVIIGGSPDHVKREFQGFMVLLSYWRDEAAHGKASAIQETEAFTSLMLLLRLARYGDETF